MSLITNTSGLVRTPYLLCLRNCQARRDGTHRHTWTYSGSICDTPANACRHLLPSPPVHVLLRLCHPRVRVQPDATHGGDGLDPEYADRAGRCVARPSCDTDGGANNPQSRPAQRQGTALSCKRQAGARVVGDAEWQAHQSRARMVDLRVFRECGRRGCRAGQEHGGLASLEGGGIAALSYGPLLIAFAALCPSSTAGPELDHGSSPDALREMLREAAKASEEVSIQLEAGRPRPPKSRPEDAPVREPRSDPTKEPTPQPGGQGQPPGGKPPCIVTGSGGKGRLSTCHQHKTGAWGATTPGGRG